MNVTNSEANSTPFAMKHDVKLVYDTERIEIDGYEPFDQRADVGNDRIEVNGKIDKRFKVTNVEDDFEHTPIGSDWKLEFEGSTYHIKYENEVRDIATLLLDSDGKDWMFATYKGSKQECATDYSYSMGCNQTIEEGDQAHFEIIVDDNSECAEIEVTCIYCHDDSFSICSGCGQWFDEFEDDGYCSGCS